jgi:hypothetical protein
MLLVSVKISNEEKVRWGLALYVSVADESRRISHLTIAAFTTQQLQTDEIGQPFDQLLLVAIVRWRR